MQAFPLSCWSVPGLVQQKSATSLSQFHSRLGHRRTRSVGRLARHPRVQCCDLHFDRDSCSALLCNVLRLPGAWQEVRLLEQARKAQNEHALDYHPLSIPAKDRGAARAVATYTGAARLGTACLVNSRLVARPLGLRPWLGLTPQVWFFRSSVVCGCAGYLAR